MKRYVEQVMGLPVSLALRGRHEDDDLARAAWADVMASLRHADMVFSTYREDSYVERLGRDEITLADCPLEVAEVLALGTWAEHESGGAFAVRREVDGVETLDPSGVVKGWAVERAAAALDRLDHTDFSINAGGDVLCRTAAPESPGWRVGIEDPHDPTRILAVVPLRNGAVATSGAVHRGAHIVDARTGRPPQGVASVTVVAESLTEADIDATAAYAMGEAGLDWLRAREDRFGIVVRSDGEAVVVGGAGN